MTLKPETSAGYLTNHAARLFARMAEERLRPLEVGTGYLPVFFALARGEALTQAALVKIVGIEQPTMAATLTRMERDGLVRRQPDPNDRRSALVTLTPLALGKLPAIEAAINAVNAAALAPLSGGERRQFLKLLATVIEALGG